MNKLFFYLTLFIVVVIGGAYTFLFTTWGNGMVASIIENKANENKQLQFKVEKFVLTMSTIDFVANIDNNSYININGGLSILGKQFDLNYDIKVEELSKLNNLTNTNLRGKLNTMGTIKGDEKLLVVDGKSDLFESRTNYNAKLVNFEPRDIVFNLNKAKIDQLLYMLNQPIYAKGFVSIEGKLKDMKGNILTKITNGKVNNSIVNKMFNQKLLRPFIFHGDIITALSKEKMDSKVNFYTTMANIFVKQARVNLKDGSIKSDYLVKVDDLSKLYDVAQMKMRGNLLLNGEVKKDKNLTVTGNSNLLGGKVDFKLFNDDFTSSIKSIELVKALHMMYYPEVFTSKTDLDLNYNLATKKGVLEGSLIDGQFKRNKFSSLLHTFAKFDLTKEVYEKVVLKSNINKDIIKSTVDMKSKLTTINVVHSTIDNKKRVVDALIKTNLKGIEFDTLVTGSLDKPEVKMDTSKLLLTNEKVRKEKKRLERKIQEKLGDKAGGLLKGLFQ